MTPSEGATFVLPQFPLESAVLPTQVLSLHVFEPRYRTMVSDLVAGDETFGVVLITRGSEVGGEDLRSEIGTLVQLQESAQLDDGRWLIAAAGIERYRIVRWLEPDPYPKAEVQRFEERLFDDEVDQVSIGERYESLARAFRRTMALYSELGGPGMVDELSPNRDVAVFQMSTLLPVGPLDKYKILERPSSLERMGVLEELTSDLADLLRFRLAEGGS